jgi:surface antigen
MTTKRGYTLKVTGIKLKALLVMFVMFGVLSPLFSVGTAKAIDSSLGYPQYQMPCEHWPYYIAGPCKNFDWGPAHTEALDDPSEISSRGYAYRNCTDYVAWKESTLGVKIPYNLGNAANWYGKVPSYQRSQIPKVWGAVVRSGGLGHVAFIESVNSIDYGNPLNSNITVSEYNYYGLGAGSIRSGTVSGLGFTGFIDFGARPSGAVITKAGFVVGSADFDHDGNADFATYSGGQWNVKSGSGSNPYLIQNLNFGSPNDTPLLGDFNKDGTADLVIYSNGQWAVKSGAAPFNYLAQGIRLGGSGDTPLLGDFNGDRVPDYTIYSNGQWAVRSGAGSPDYIAQGLRFGQTGDTPLVADFNKDGIADYVINSGGQWAIRAGGSNSQYIAQGLKLGDGGCRQFAKDYNNDGAADYIVNCGGQWAVRSGAGTSPFLMQGVMLGKSTDVPLVGDYNADRILDLGVDSNGQWAVKSGAPPYNYIKQGVLLGSKFDWPLGG